MAQSQESALSYRFKVLLLFTATAGVLAYLSGAFQPRVPEAVLPPEKPVPVVLCPAVKRDVPVFRTGIGTVQAFNSVQIVARVEGELTKLHFAEGGMVKAGDPLVQIDDRRYVAALRQADADISRETARLVNAQAEFGRTSELVKRAISTAQLFDQQKSNVAQIAAQVESMTALRDRAALDLENTAIRSPIDGRVGLRTVDAGAYLRPGDNITVVNQLQPILATFTLPAEAINSVAEAISRGGHLEVAAMSRDQAEVIEQGHLLTIDGQIDAKTGTFRLKAVFDNKQSLLWPGQFINARLKLMTRNDALTVPEQALQRGPDGSFVFVVSHDRAEQRPVAVSMAARGLAIVEHGLADGENVVIDGQYKLKDGSIVASRARLLPALNPDSERGCEPQNQAGQ